MIRKIVGLYFSPIGGTAKVTEALVSKLAGILDDCSPDKLRRESIDLLRLKDTGLKLDDETVAVVCMPVCIGKIPLPAVRLMKNIDPNGAITVAAVSYGARTYGNALYELNHYAEDQGFKVVGAGAFSVKYNKRRGKSPDSIIDDAAIKAFGTAAAGKIRRLAGCEIEGLRIKPAPLEVSGRLPFHGISRISPGAAMAAQGLLHRVNFKHKDSEWYL